MKAQANGLRGAYCAMVMISLLRIPLELPEDAPARHHGMTSFLDDLPRWLTRCEFLLSSENVVAEVMLQVKRMKGGFQALQAQKHMGATLFVL